MASFDRPIGAEADVRELEYISFLHQTSLDVRTDCSIKDEDIRAYLMSRYGIDVPLEIVRETILQGLGGGNDDTTVIDLMELMAIILIPVLLKSDAVSQFNDSVHPSNKNLLSPTAAQGPLDNGTGAAGAGTKAGLFGSVWKSITNFCSSTKNDSADDMDAAIAATLADELNTNQRIASLASGVVLPPDNLMEYAAKVILHDITGDSQPKPLTIELLQDILRNYGEHQLADDESLVREMLACAKDTNDIEGTLMFDGASFATAATYDVQLFDVSNETKMTTLYDDVFPEQLAFRRNNRNAYDTGNHHREQKGTNPVGGDGGDDTEFGADLYTTKIALNRKFTAPAIDVTAGTYRSKSLMVMLWASAILTFCTYYLRRVDNKDDENYITRRMCVDYPYNKTLGALEAPWTTNRVPMACDTGRSVIDWLTLFLLIGAYGLAYTSIGSIGNTVECNTWFHPLIGCVPVVVLSSISFVNTSNSMQTYLAVLSVFSVLLSVIVMYLHVTHAIAIVVSEDHLQRHPGIRNWLSDDSIEYLRSFFKPRLVEAEMLGKKAMAHKVNQLVVNALNLFQTRKDDDVVIDKFYGRAIHAYAKYGVRKTQKGVGSITWTWSNIWNKHIFDMEGIWFSVRVLGSNIGQFIVCIFIVWAGYRLLFNVNSNYGDKEELKTWANDILSQQIQKQQTSNITANVTSLFGSYMYDLQVNQSSAGIINCSDYTNNQDEWLLCRNDSATGELDCKTTTDVNRQQLENYCSLATNQNLTADERLQLLNDSGYDIDRLEAITSLSIETSINQVVDSMYPNKQYMVSVPTAMGVLIAFITSCMLFATYLSSVTSTILQLRCGYIETMWNADSRHIRAAPDTVALLTGSIFWGSLAASALTGATWGLVVFIFVWQATVFFAQRFLAIVIGLLSITIIKLVSLLMVRNKYYAGFYRTRPVVTNIAILALEWANFTLSSGIIFVRMVKLLVIAGFSVGRVFRPFLAPGVGRIGPIELDGYFTIFLRELLAHEAHRHPYIESLGYIYLMKLRHSDKFGKNAGSCWRLIFVHALFPWLQKYRITTRGLNVPIMGPNHLSNFRSIRRIPNTPSSVQMPQQYQPQGAQSSSPTGTTDRAGFYNVRPNRIEEANNNDPRSRRTELSLSHTPNDQSYREGVERVLGEIDEDKVAEDKVLETAPPPATATANPSTSVIDSGRSNDNDDDDDDGFYDAGDNGNGDNNNDDENDGENFRQSSLSL